MDPLTIYQDNFTEKFINNEHGLISKVNLTTPSVFTDANSSLVSLSPHVDIEILHPKTVYINGRPDWMYRDGLRKTVEVDKNRIADYPVMISAVPMGEFDSVPVDRIELKHQYDTKAALVLAPGAYRIEIYDGTNVTELELEVK